MRTNLGQGEDRRRTYKWSHHQKVQFYQWFIDYLMQHNLLNHIEDKRQFAVLSLCCFQHMIMLMYLQYDYIRNHKGKEENRTIHRVKQIIVSGTVYRMTNNANRYRYTTCGAWVNQGCILPMCPQGHSQGKIFVKKIDERFQSMPYNL